MDYFNPKKDKKEEEIEESEEEEKEEYLSKSNIYDKYMSKIDENYVINEETE